MELVGDLKKQVEETKNKEEAKEIIEKAGMVLTDDELENVTGGAGGTGGRCPKNPKGYHIFTSKGCTLCGAPAPKNS